MGEPHSEVQESQASGHQNIDDADISLQDMIDDLLESELYRQGYTGPGAYMIEEIVTETGMGRDTVVRWGAKMVKDGKWVEVDVPNPDRGAPGQPPILRGWVKKEIYDEWVKSNVSD